MIQRMVVYFVSSFCGGMFVSWFVGLFTKFDTFQSMVVFLLTTIIFLLFNMSTGISALIQSVNSIIYVMRLTNRNIIPAIEEEMKRLYNEIEKEKKSK